MAADPADDLTRLGQFDSIDDLIRFACEARNSPMQHLGFILCGNPRGYVLRYADGRVIVGGEASAEKPLSRNQVGEHAKV